MSAKQARRWVRGTPLTAERLNETTDLANDLSGRVSPPRVSLQGAGSIESSEDEDNTEAPAEVWAWVASSTRTERLEDADDDTIYIDVEITRSVTVRKPNGELVRIQLENPDNG